MDLIRKEILRNASTPIILSQDFLVNTPHMKMPMLYTLVLFCFLVKWATE